MVHIAIQSRNCLPAVSFPRCALFVVRPTSSVENSSRCMTFRQVHRSGEHWHFLIIFFSSQGWGVVQHLGRLRLRLGKKTIPVPAPDPAPSKMFQRFWLRLRGCEVVQISDGSGSGCNLHIKKNSTPAPAPSKMSRRLRLRFRIPATSSSRNCLTAVPPPPPLCLVRGPALTFFNYCSKSQSRNCLPAVFALCRVRSPANICCRTQSDV